MINGDGALRRPERGRGRDRRRHRAGRVRLALVRHRFDAPEAGVVPARRRPHPDDAVLLPTRGVPAQRHGRRLGCHRRRVRAHVRLVRRRGHAGRVPPAGAAEQGSRGCCRARGGLPRPWRATAQGRAGDGDRARRRERHRRRAAATTVGSCDRPRRARDRVGAEHGRSRARRRRRRSRCRRLHPDRPQLRHQRAAHLRRRRRQRQAPAVVGGRDARPQGGRAGDGPAHRAHRHLDYDKAASAIFTEPEIADVGLAEAEAFAPAARSASRRCRSRRRRRR